MNSHNFISRVSDLGKDQWKWLNMYGKINLEHWRFELIGDSPEWVYVGEWTPGPITPWVSHQDPGEDGGYTERAKNINSNRYYYWP